MRLKLMKKICKICNFQTINYPNSPDSAFSLDDEELTDGFLERHQISLDIPLKQIMTK